METLLKLFLDLKSFIWGGALIVAAILVLGLLNRFLQRNADKVAGRRFRNQLTMTGAGFVVLLVVILALPIDTAMRGQLLSLVGIIISAAIALSSSTVLSNAMAGIMLKTVRNFHSGDFITAGDFFGRVTERGLFHTEIQTADRDLVTLPNMFLATVPVTVVRSSGTIVSATLSLGYDIPQSRIKELLLKAAEAVELSDAFVQVLALGDFSVTYRVAGLLEDSKQLLSYRSRLNSSVLDTLHKGGVEIVSPAFMNVRDFHAQKNFIPEPVRIKKKPDIDSAPIDVAFDKAEVAASVSALSMERTKIEELLKNARQAVKDAKEDPEKQKAEGQVVMLEAQLEELDQNLAAEQEKEKEHDI